MSPVINDDKRLIVIWDVSKRTSDSNILDVFDVYYYRSFLDDDRVRYIRSTRTESSESAKYLIFPVSLSFE